jgi:hypothetical protein
MFPEPPPDAPEEVALCRADAVLRVVDPRPQLQVNGIISEARQEAGRLGAISSGAQDC